MLRRVRTQLLTFWVIVNLPSSMLKKNVSSTACPFEMGPVACPETSVTNYQPTQDNTPQDRRSYWGLFICGIIQTILIENGLCRADLGTLCLLRWSKRSNISDSGGYNMSSIVIRRGLSKDLRMSEFGFL
jgi:hypothetical protein